MTMQLPGFDLSALRIPDTKTVMQSTRDNPILSLPSRRATTRRRRTAFSLRLTGVQMATRPLQGESAVRL